MFGDDDNLVDEIAAVAWFAGPAQRSEVPEDVAVAVRVGSRKQNNVGNFRVIALHRRPNVRKRDRQFSSGSAHEGTSRLAAGWSQCGQ